MVVGLVTNLALELSQHFAIAEYSAQSTPSTWNFLVHSNPRCLTVLTTHSAWPCSRPSPWAARRSPVRGSPWPAGNSYSPSAEMNLAVLLHEHKLLLNFTSEGEIIIESGASLHPTTQTRVKGVRYRNNSMNYIDDFCNNTFVTIRRVT